MSRRMNSAEVAPSCCRREDVPGLGPVKFCPNSGTWFSWTPMPITDSSSAYNSDTGEHLLVAQGARLVGLYDHHIVYGQERVLITRGASARRNRRDDAGLRSRTSARDWVGCATLESPHSDRRANRRVKGPLPCWTSCSCGSSAAVAS